MIALITLLGATNPDGSPASIALTAEAIYLRSVDAMKLAPLPAYVSFRETVLGRNIHVSCSSNGIQVTIHHGDMSAAYDVDVRTSDGSAVSRDVANASASPCPEALLVPAGKDISAMGMPHATPSPGTQDVSGVAGGPPIIAAVRVNGSRYYHIDFVGREALDGNDVYHLRLRAYRDANEHPLTDLYVDPGTYLVREARGEASAHFVIGSGRAAGIVDFDRVGEFWLVKRERFDAAANAVFVHVRAAADITATNMTTPPELPGVTFPTASPSPVPRK